MPAKTLCPHDLPLTRCDECLAEYKRQKYLARKADPKAYAAMMAKNEEYRRLRKAEKANPTGADSR